MTPADKTLATRELCVLAWQYHSPRLQHVRPMDVRQRTGKFAGETGAPPTVFRQRLISRGHAVAGHESHRQYLSHRGRVRRRVWVIARLWDLLSESDHHTIVPSHPPARMAVCDPVRRHRTDARRDRDAGGGGAFCSSRWHDRRVYGHPPLASPRSLELIELKGGSIDRESVVLNSS